MSGLRQLVSLPYRAGHRIQTLNVNNGVNTTVVATKHIASRSNQCCSLHGSAVNCCNNMSKFNAHQVRLTPQTTLRQQSPRYISTSHIRYNAEQNNNNSQAESSTQSQSNDTTTNTANNTTDSTSNKELTDLQAKVTELTDQRLRALAETENVRQRSRADLQSARLYAIQGFAKQLLEVCDTLELMSSNAAEHVDDTNQHFKSLFDGVNMTNKILHKILANNGMKKMSSEGEKFDPYKHEVLFQVDDTSKEPGTIATVMREGYMMHDRTLRAAQVGTVRKPANNTATSEPSETTQ